ncbi:MAG: hypothetical protein ABI772_08360 [Bacteroidota bacterium]
MKNIPKINLFYWALIISANTLGETAGDLISQTFNLGYAVGTVLLLILFLIALTISIYSKSQKPIVYWTVITLASTLGTTISDLLSRTLSVNYLGVTEETGYICATIFLVFSLAMIFGIWKWYSKTDNIESGFSKTTECLYWFAILTSSTLGTAFGDLLAHDTPLGFDGGTLLLSALLLIVILLVFLTKISKELLYWSAIILTHPIGATMGDYLTKSEGLNLGNIKASLLLVVVFIIVIVTGKLTLKKQ